VQIRPLLRPENARKTTSLTRERSLCLHTCVDRYAALGSHAVRTIEAVDLHENSLKSRRSDNSHEEPRYICMQGHFTGAGRPVETTALTPEPFPSHVGALMARSVVNEQLRNAIDTQQFSTEFRSDQLELLLSQPAVE
jgi:hypothetical protein